jgi:hypothetical protein
MLVLRFYQLAKTKLELLPPKLMAKVKMLMAIPLLQNAGKDKAYDSKIGGETPC